MNTAFDPRTIARNIPGIFDVLFPHLSPGLVMNLNRSSQPVQGCEAVPEYLVRESKLQHAMLMEIAFACCEQLLRSDTISWSDAIETALARQRRHFDAKPATEVTKIDKAIAGKVGKNLASALRQIEGERAGQLLGSPRIPGYQWIASGCGDFCVGRTLIEVKCTNKIFSSSDYRQVLLYWLLSYAAAIEKDELEWSEVILLNPRLNLFARFETDEIIDVFAGGRSKVEILELFGALAGDLNSNLTGRL